MWILALGLLLEVLTVNYAHAEIFRRRRVFARPNNFLQVGRLNNGFNNFNNFNSFNSGNRFSRNQNNQNLKEVLGFSQLLQAGNNIIEKTSEGLIRRLQIRGNGELVAFDPRVGSIVRPEAETIRHLRQFYLKNLDKFSGRNQGIVNRFLAANGGISNGKFIVDLDTFDLPNEAFSSLPLEERRKAGLAALNHLLNTLQTRFKLRIPPAKVVNGKVELNLGGFFRQEALAIMAQADPTSQCTGKFRLNNLIAFTMDPENYYRILGAPDNARDLSNILGVQLDKTKTVGNKLAILGHHESGVAPGDQRIIEVQSTQNVAVNGVALSSCYRSLDTQDRPQPGIEAESRNVRLKGINWQHEAEEWLCLGQNGFIQTYLFNNPDGKRLNEAPASIAHGGGIGPAIRAGAACLDCHSGGFIAGGIKPSSVDGSQRYEDYTKKTDSFPTSPTVFRDSLGNFLNHRDFFTSNDNYIKRAKFDSDIFVNAQKETGSFYRYPEGSALADLNPKGGPRGTDVSVPLIPRARELYDLPLTPKVAARELGISEQAAGQLIGKEISRTVFDARYCNLQQGVNADRSEFQNRDLLQRESEEPFSGFSTGTSHLNGALFNGNQFNGNQFNRSQFNGSQFNGNQFNRNQFNRSQFNRSQFNRNQFIR